MSALPEAKSSEPDARSLSDVRHLVLVLILSVLPAAAAAAFPPTVLDEKNQTFLTLYLVTLPWSLALCAIVVGFVRGWFGPDESKQVLAAAGILVVSAVIGAAIAPGSPLDEHFQGGPPWVVVAEAIVFVVIGYALMYGWPMWLASFLFAAYVGWWLRERFAREEVAADAGGAGLLDRLEARPPSVSVARAAVTRERSNSAPPLRNDASFEDAIERLQPSAPPKDDELVGLTKAELYRRARQAGIKGRSAMSKDQLAAALRSQNA
jgi:hypothetical protein